MTNKTGPVKIGDHWPGIYITGQDALISIYSDVQNAVRQLERAYESDPYPMTKCAIRDLRKLLKLFDSCDEGKMMREGREPLRVEVKET